MHTGPSTLDSVFVKDCVECMREQRPGPAVVESWLKLRLWIFGDQVRARVSEHRQKDRQTITDRERERERLRERERVTSACSA